MQTILKAMLALVLIAITQISTAAIPTICPTASVAQTLISAAAGSLSSKPEVGAFKFYQISTSDGGTLDYYTQTVPTRPVGDQVRYFATLMQGAPQSVTVSGVLHCFYTGTGSLDANAAPQGTQVLAIEYPQQSTLPVDVAVSFAFPSGVTPDVGESATVTLANASNSYSATSAPTVTATISNVLVFTDGRSDIYNYSATKISANGQNYCAADGTVSLSTTNKSFTVTYAACASPPPPPTVDVDVTVSFAFPSGVTPAADASTTVSLITATQNYSVTSAPVGTATITGVAVSADGSAHGYNYSATNVLVSGQNYCATSGTAPLSTANKAFTVTFAACGTPPVGAGQIYAYYTNWSVYARNFFPNQIPMNTVNLVLYAFEQIGNCGGRNGTPSHDCPGATQDNLLHSTDTWADYQMPMHGGATGAMPDVITRAHAAGQKVSVSIGGYSLSDQLTDMMNDTQIPGCTDNGVQIPASSGTVRTNFINSLWTGPDPMLTNYSFDGVDIDFEPNGNHWGTTSLPSGACYQPVSAQIIQNYAQFLTDLKAALTAHDSTRNKLTIALTANPDDVNYIASVTCDNGAGGTESCLTKIANAVDTINVMAYDYHGGWDSTPPGVTNFSAALYADDAEPGTAPDAGKFNINSTIAAYKAAGVPMSKIVLGIPTYTRLESGASEGSIPNAAGLYTSFTGVPAGEYGADGVYDYKCALSFFGNEFGVQPLPAGVCQVASAMPGAIPYMRLNSSNQMVGSAAYSPILNTFMSMDGVGDSTIDTLTPKIAYVKANGIDGVMFWELSGDLNPTDYPTKYQQYSLIHNAYQQLNPSAAKK